MNLRCLSILKSSKSYSSKEEENSRLLQASNLEKIEYISEYNFQIKIENSLFQYNKALYGGACYISSVNILLDKCSLIQNEAQNKGGGIYYQSNNTYIKIINSIIVNNTANSAGGIYLSDTQIGLTNQINFFMKDNKAYSFGDNIVEHPNQLKIKLNSQIVLENTKVLQNTTAVIEEAQIQPYFIYGQKLQTETLFLPSGIKISNYKYFDNITYSYIPYNYSFRILAINSFGEEIVNLGNSFCQINAQEINNTKELDLYYILFYIYILNSLFIKPFYLFFLKNLPQLIKISIPQGFLDFQPKN